MRSYIPNTKDEQRLMLDVIGVTDIEELLTDIPKDLRLKEPMKLPASMSEYELNEHMKLLASANFDGICFMGGGIYDHYIPAAVGHLAGREEFYTAYTPYQAEMSQGTLQGIFEYQSYMAMLTGMDVSNASVYDGATACAEAMLMANVSNDKNQVIVCGTLNPEYTATCRTYAGFRGISIVEANYCDENGVTDMKALQAAITEDTSSIIVQSPNCFGLIEDVAEISKIAKANGIVLIVAANPISLGLLKTPGELGADIAVGEGQPLGSPMSYGGPGFGYLACKKEYLRRMPGRIAGETTDKNGKRGFVLTMQAREQHIRREKATSNICSNQALNALRAAIYLSLMGKEGFKQVSELCCQKAKYLHDGLVATGCFEPRFKAGFFNEFVLRYKGDLAGFINKMTDAGFMPGISLTNIPGFENCLLVAVTEKRTKAQMDRYIEIGGERS